MVYVVEWKLFIICLALAAMCWVNIQEPGRDAPRAGRGRKGHVSE
jgi:hypothetical protein